ncbi:lipase member I-like isoform X2 [Galleria mellonella]|uniref:Lipase member I-like isoform X2 n=1 Tax=Galleria mellonella TaxID=7137 RepID=A0ABM3MBD5_GALME|nr:lipase member I-like isoform X2 [Galleria mellonella]
MIGEDEAASSIADNVISKFGNQLRFQHVPNDEGGATLTDNWLKVADLIPSAYLPTRDNQFHLFTRDNPTVSQPLLLYNGALLLNSNFNASRRTVILIHGHGGSALSNFNLVLIPSYLAAADVNVILVDWSRGANSNTVLSLVNIALSARNVKNFIEFVTSTTGQSLADVSLVGVGLGGLQAGLIGRRLRRQVGYIAALDPTYWSAVHELLPQFRANDGVYTEVIHTNVGNRGYIKPMGQVDIYPNGGINMPGCGRDDACDQERAYYYWAEALTSGGFTARQCTDYEEALLQECQGATLTLGGIEPKTGASGIYSLQTNPSPPFSQG